MRVFTAEFKSSLAVALSVIALVIHLYNFWTASQ